MELFKTWKKNMVLYGLKSQIGTVYRNSDRTTSFYDIGNFLYLAGELDSRFWEDFVRKYGLDYKIIISENANWQDFLHRQVGLISFTRYSFKDKANFQKLKTLLEEVDLDKISPLQALQILYKIKGDL
mgnify:CR=1 FL=1